MSKRTKIIIGVVAAVVVVGALTASIRGRDKNVPPGDHRQSREDRPGIQGHGQRKDPGPPQGRHVRARHGPDRQPGGQRGRPRQAGPAPAADRPGAAGGAGPGPRSEPGGDAPRSRRGQGQCRAGEVRLRARQAELPGQDPGGGRLSKGQVEPRLGRGDPRRDRAAHELDERRPGRQPRLALQDDRDGAHRGHRDLPADQGRRGHGHRHDEQRRHAAADDLRHGRGRGGDDGRRDLGAAGEGRAEGRARDRRLSEPQVRGHDHGGRLVADLEDGSGPADAHGQLGGHQLQGEDPSRQPAGHDPAGLLGDGRHRHGPHRRRDRDPDPGARRARRSDEGQEAGGRRAPRDRGRRLHRQGRQARVREGRDRASPAS